MKKIFAAVGIFGMLASPLALAQAQDSDLNAPATAQGTQPASAQSAQPAGAQTAPQSGQASGLAESIGISNTAVTVGIGAAVAIGIAAAASGSSSSGTTGTN